MRETRQGMDAGRGRFVAGCYRAGGGGPPWPPFSNRFASRPVEYLFGPNIGLELDLQGRRRYGSEYPYCSMLGKRGQVVPWRGFNLKPGYTDIGP